MAEKRKSAVATAAREKARQLKAERDKERADLEAKILAAVEGYHVAGAAETEAEIEAMCEIDGAGLRRAKRQVAKRKKSSTPKPVEAEPGAGEPLGSGSAAVA